MAEPRVLKLQSPAYSDPIFYKWPLVITKKHDEAAEIVETIRLVCEDFPELKYAVENVMCNGHEPTDYDSMNKLCQRYNKAIRNILSLWKGRAPPPRMFKPPSKDLLRHIINLCYSHAIKEPEKLNQYEPFSPEVYGETSFDMIARILEELQNCKDDTFVDLGSGVGQVVLQAAATNQFKECFGVEKAETPAMYAKEMEIQFKKWMDWFGKIYTDFTLERGDFLEDKWKDVINDGGVIFVNNFAFGPVVNHHLKARFQTMKEGSKVISSREYCPLNFKFNKRNLSELGAMMRVNEIKPRSEESSVSWTGNTVSYYLHVVDRTRLEKYFSILKKRKEGQDLDEDELSLYSESNYSMDTSGQAVDVETLEDNLDDLYLGTTTRHQWQLLTETIKQSKQDADGRAKKSKTSGKMVMKSGGKKLQKFDLKKKILRKYGQQAMQRAKQASKDEQEELPISDTESEKEVVVKKKRGRKPLLKTELTKKPATNEENKMKHHKKYNNTNLSNDLDNFLACMKERYLEFIKRMNTKQYAERLQVMIECETAKKKLLQREINETERSVQQLISDGLKNFSRRLVELDVAVKTPLELLSQSETLTEKRKTLENKVISMEIEIYNLEEKHKTLCTARDKSNRLQGLQPLYDSDNENLNQETASKTQLTTKLCGAILSALNHRKSLIDKQSSISEQVSILEKISNPLNGESTKEHQDGEPTEQKPEWHRSKARPIALVPPRMLSEDKKVTLSPETLVSTTENVQPDSEPNESVEPQRRPRGRPKKRPKLTEGSSRDSSQESETNSSELNHSASNSQQQREHIRTPLNDLNAIVNQVGSQPDHPPSTIHQSFYPYYSQGDRPVSQPDRPPTTVDQSYFAYYTQGDQPPVVFPSHSSEMKKDLSKDFLKTSSRLLNSTSKNISNEQNLWVPLSTSRTTTSYQMPAEGLPHTRNRHDSSSSFHQSMVTVSKSESVTSTGANQNSLVDNKISPTNLPPHYNNSSEILNKHVPHTHKRNIYDNLQFTGLRNAMTEQHRLSDINKLTENYLYLDKQTSKKLLLPDQHILTQSVIQTLHPSVSADNAQYAQDFMSQLDQYSERTSANLTTSSTSKKDTGKLNRKRKKKQTDDPQTFQYSSIVSGSVEKTRNNVAYNTGNEKRDCFDNKGVIQHFQYSKDLPQAQSLQKCGTPERHAAIASSYQPTPSFSSGYMAFHRNLNTVADMQPLESDSSNDTRYQNQSNKTCVSSALNSAKPLIHYPVQISSDLKSLHGQEQQTVPTVIQRETVLKSQPKEIQAPVKRQKTDIQTSTHRQPSDLYNAHSKQSVGHSSVIPLYCPNTLKLLKSQPVAVNSFLPVPSFTAATTSHLQLLSASTIAVPQLPTAVSVLQHGGNEIVQQKLKEVIRQDSTDKSTERSLPANVPSGLLLTRLSSVNQPSVNIHTLSSSTPAVRTNASTVCTNTSIVPLNIHSAPNTITGGYPTYFTIPESKNSTTNRGTTKIAKGQKELTPLQYAVLNQSYIHLPRASTAPQAGSANNPTVKKPRGRRPKKLDSTTNVKTQDHLKLLRPHLAAASPVPVVYTNPASQTIGTTLMKPQAIYSSSAAAIHTKPKLNDFKNDIKPQVINLIQPSSSGLGSIIIPNMFTPNTMAASTVLSNVAQATTYTPQQQRLVLVPASKIQDSNNNTGLHLPPNKLERQQSMTSPTFPPTSS